MIDQFSRLHRGKFTHITAVDPDQGPSDLTRDRPLLGLVDERHGDADESITAMWGDLAGGTFSHSIRRPKRLALSEWNDANSGELEIESRDGQRLVIQAGPVGEVLPPEVMTDGVRMDV
jgi:hypothetical protein